MFRKKGDSGGVKELTDKLDAAIASSNESTEDIAAAIAAVLFVHILKHSTLIELEGVVAAVTDKMEDWAKEAIVGEWKNPLQ